MADLLGLHPEVLSRVEAMLSALRRAGHRPTITSAFRSSSDQERLFQAFLARGRRGLPAARPGLSTHEYGFAVDVIGVPPAALAAAARAAGLVWAGAKDPVHVDLWGFPLWQRILRAAAILP